MFFSMPDVDIAIFFRRFLWCCRILITWLMIADITPCRPYAAATPLRRYLRHWWCCCRLSPLLRFDITLISCFFSAFAAALRHATMMPLTLPAAARHDAISLWYDTLIRLLYDYFIIGFYFLSFDYAAYWGHVAATAIIIYAIYAITLWCCFTLIYYAMFRCFYWFFACCH